MKPPPGSETRNSTPELKPDSTPVLTPVSATTASARSSRKALAEMPKLVSPATTASATTALATPAPSTQMLPPSRKVPKDLSKTLLKVKSSPKKVLPKKASLKRQRRSQSPNPSLKKI